VAPMSPFPKCLCFVGHSLHSTDIHEVSSRNPKGVNRVMRFGGWYALMGDSKTPACHCQAKLLPTAAGEYIFGQLS